MSIDPIGNFLTIIRNGIKVSRHFVLAPHSRIKQAIAQILKDEGFVKGFDVLEDESGKKTLKIYLKYVRGESVIHELKRVSSPGRRMYRGADELGHIRNKLGLSIVTTSRGIITDKQARDLSVGGEVLLSVW